MHERQGSLDASAAHKDGSTHEDGKAGGLGVVNPEGRVGVKHGIISKSDSDSYPPRATGSPY